MAGKELYFFLLYLALVILLVVWVAKSTVFKTKFKPDSYPCLRRACLMIALDNGWINRYNPREQQAGFSLWLVNQPRSALDMAETVLMKLSKSALEDFAIGGSDERLAVATKYNIPIEVDDLLDDYFNNGMSQGSVT